MLVGMPESLQVTLVVVVVSLGLLLVLAAAGRVVWRRWTSRVRCPTDGAERDVELERALDEYAGLWPSVRVTACTAFPDGHPSCDGACAERPDQP